MLRRFLRFACFAALAASTHVFAFIIPYTYAVVEFVNRDTGHYLLLSDFASIAWLDGGGDGGGWERTGFVFEEQDLNNAPQSPVCRFYSPAFNTHFYTSHAPEREALKAPGSGWTYEGAPFRGPTPTATGCPAGTVTVRRLYNREADHRYSADPAIVSAMLSRGWIDEGLGFCAYASYIAAEKVFELQSSSPGDEEPLPLSQCAQKVGGCLGLVQLPALPTKIFPWNPPNYVTRNPAYPREVEQVTGVADGVIRTMEATGSAAVLTRSFAQLWIYGGAPMGIHIQSSDRVGGPYAGMHALYQLPGVAGAGADERVFPWRGRDRRLVITSDLSVKVVRLMDGAQAYGLPLIQFADAASGRSLYVTLQAFGTIPPGDYVGPDFSTGWAIVSTSFRADPAFGERLSGDFVLCAAGGQACIPTRTRYKFALTRADFEKILARARTVDPSLSASPSNYFVAAFRQHNETYLDAELGMTVHRVALEIFPIPQ